MREVWHSMRGVWHSRGGLDDPLSHCINLKHLKLTCIKMVLVQSTNVVLKEMLFFVKVHV
jgi:hypothetical protein